MFRSFSNLEEFYDFTSRKTQNCRERETLPDRQIHGWPRVASESWDIGMISRHIWNKGTRASNNHLAIRSYHYRARCSSCSYIMGLCIAFLSHGCSASGIYQGKKLLPFSLKRLRMSIDRCVSFFSMGHGCFRFTREHLWRLGTYHLRSCAPLIPATRRNFVTDIESAIPRTQ